MTRDAPFKRRVRARLAKTGESYVTARAQLDDPDRGRAATPVVTTVRSAEGTQTTVVLQDNVLNVTNGDAVAEVLRGPNVQLLPWWDVLHDGPVPALPPAALRRVRAAFLGSQGFADEARALADLGRRDRMLDGFADRSYILWFEADLYDQLQLVQVLDRLRALRVPPDRIHLVSAGEFPGVARFAGLGQLDHRALMRLLRDAVPLTQDDLDIAARAWRAFTAADPAALGPTSQLRSASLRFLGEAFGRLMQEYPWRVGGLSLTQRRQLLALDGGAATAGEVFAEAARRELRPYLGDWSAFALLRGLATARHPLVAVDGDAAPTDPAYAAQPVRLTQAGRDVLEGRADHVQLNGVDRWVGGVRLRGRQVRWRYDELRETLVTS